VQQPKSCGRELWRREGLTYCDFTGGVARYSTRRRGETVSPNRSTSYSMQRNGAEEARRANVGRDFVLGSTHYHVPCNPLN
jgi:hypothetical protein